MIDPNALKNIASQLNNEKMGSGGPSKFFRPEQNRAYTVRIMPDKDGAPMKMFAQHYGLGRTFVCPKATYNKKCPVCDHIISNWKSSTVEVQNKFKEISSKKRWYSVVYVRELNEVLIWSYSPTVAKQILALFEDPEYGDISDVSKGCDIEVKITKDPKRNFADTTVKPKRNVSPLIGTEKNPKALDEERAEALLSKMPVIEDEMNLLKTSEIDEMFLAYSLNDDSAKSAASDDDIGDAPENGKKGASAPDDDLPF